MPFFNKTPILLDEETLAEQLRRRRQASGLKLEEASKRLKIKVAYLDALEKGRYDLLPSGVYGRNFLREYA
ncbi:MAG: helix-turn-helix domain-containing protein, partial [Ignavibacteria bacterium]